MGVCFHSEATDHERAQSAEVEFLMFHAVLMVSHLSWKSVYFSNFISFVIPGTSWMTSWTSFTLALRLHSPCWSLKDCFWFPPKKSPSIASSKRRWMLIRWEKIVCWKRFHGILSNTFTLNLHVADIASCTSYLVRKPCLKRSVSIFVWILRFYPVTCT